MPKKTLRNQQATESLSYKGVLYKGERSKPLRAFCHVARLGSISRAADAMFLSQPAVTLQLQALEREYGTKLFERAGRRLTLTQEGEVLYELAQPVMDGLDGLEQSYRQRVKGLSGGQLNVAAGSSTILYLLPELVQQFKQSYPEVELILHNVTGQDGLSLLRSDSVDLAVGSMLDVPTDLSYAPVYNFDPMLIMPKGHVLASKAEITLEDLSPHGLILPPKRLTTYRLVDLVFQQSRVPYTVALEVGGWEVIKQYVTMGLGLSIVTSICLNEADHARLETRNLSAYFPSRSYGVVIRKGKYLSNHARRFIDLIKPDLFQRRDYFESGHSDR